MRLIDADALMGRIAGIKWKYTDDANAIEIIGMQYANAMNDLALDLIHRTPTAYDIDKVVEELEYYKSQYEKISLSINDEAERRIYIAKDATMYNAIEIVKQGLKEQNK